MKIVTVEQLGLAIQKYFNVQDIRIKKRDRELVEIRRIMYYIAKYRLPNMEMIGVAKWLNQGHGMESYHADKIHARILGGDVELEVQIQQILSKFKVNRTRINLIKKYNYLFEAHEKIKKQNKELRTEIMLEKQKNLKLQKQLLCYSQLSS